MHGLFKVKLPNTSLRKLDRLAFGYFNSCSVVLCLFVWLACLGFRFLVTLSFCLSFDVFAWLLICVLNVKIFSKPLCTRWFPTDRSETIRKIKFGKFLLKIRAIRAYAFVKLSWLVWLLFECFSYCF